MFWAIYRKPCQNFLFRCSNNEREQITAFAAAKGGEKMKPGKHEIHKQHTFDCYCKRVLKNEACNIQKEYSRRRNKEISFDELSEQELQSLCVSDEYFADEYIFDILGGSVTVRNERLAKALQSLTERKRDIILLSYFLDMTDREIAEKLNMVRKNSTVPKDKLSESIKEKIGGQQQ